MKYLKIIILLICLTFLGITISCERDDICPASTPTTPKLIIEFYDSANPESVKFVSNLRVQGVGNDNVLDGYSSANVNNIELPLRTDTTATQYILHKDYPDGNEDKITIKYTTEQVFVSRACGYKTIFKNVSLTIEPDTDNWIVSRESVTDNQSVEDETTAHFYLFF